jgi:hypothetical protein
MPSPQKRKAQAGSKLQQRQKVIDKSNRTKAYTGKIFICQEAHCEKHRYPLSKRKDSSDSEAEY